MPSWACGGGGIGGGWNAPEGEDGAAFALDPTPNAGPDVRPDPAADATADPAPDPKPGAGAVRRAAAAMALAVVRTDGDVTVGSGPTTDPLDGGNIGDDEDAPSPTAGALAPGAGIDILRRTSFRGRCGGGPESELDIVVCPESCRQLAFLLSVPPFLFAQPVCDARATVGFYARKTCTVAAPASHATRTRRRRR